MWQGFEHELAPRPKHQQQRKNVHTSMRLAKVLINDCTMSFVGTVPSRRFLGGTSRVRAMRAFCPPHGMQHDARKEAVRYFKHPMSPTHLQRKANDQDTFTKKSAPMKMSKWNLAVLLRIRVTECSPTA